jgi:hypothetical protein
MASGAESRVGAVPLPRQRRRVILWALLALFLALDAVVLGKMLAIQPLGVDFTPPWAAAQMAAASPDELYDFESVTRAQVPLLGPGLKVRPYIYPPSALPLHVLFGLLPLWPGYVAFVATGAALFAFAAWRLTRDGLAVALALAITPSAFGAMTGQISFLIGGLGLTALLLKDRPRVAGALLGSAAAFKPQLLVLAPLALIAARDYRTLAAAMVSGAALCGLSLAIWGPQVWLDWFAALPRFQRVIAADPGFQDMVVSPTGYLAYFGLARPWMIAVQLACAGLAAAIVWLTFSRTERPEYRLLAMFGGGLLASPYALQYDVTVLAPAAAALAVRDGPRNTAHVLAFVLLASGVLGLLAALAVTWAAATFPSRPTPARL